MCCPYSSLLQSDDRNVFGRKTGPDLVFRMFEYPARREIKETFIRLYYVTRQRILENILCVIIKKYN